MVFGLTMLWSVSHATSCLNLSFDDADVCIWIDKDGDNYQLTTDIDNTSNTSLALVCHILLPDGQDRNVSANSCQGDFKYYDEDTAKVKLYVIVNGEYKTIEEDYDFDVGDRDENASSSTEDLDNFYLTLSDTTPSIDQSITLTIEARDADDSTITDYSGDPIVYAQYRTSSTASRQTASSTKFYVSDSTPSFSNGRATATIKFRNDYEYRIYVEDEDANIDDYKQVAAGDAASSSNSDIDGFTSKEYDQIKAVYTIRPNIISQLERDYRRLRYDNERKDSSDELYNNMKDVVTDESSRTFDNYDNFFDAFLDRYSFTIEVR
jgi:hypothetical protein